MIVSTNIILPILFISHVHFLSLSLSCQVKAQAQLKAACTEIDTLNHAISRLKQQDAFVQGYVKSMLMPPTGQFKGGEGSNHPCGAELETVSKLLAFHSEQGAAVIALIPNYPDHPEHPDHDSHANHPNHPDHASEVSHANYANYANYPN